MAISTDTEAGTRAVEFIDRLSHTKGQWARKPFNLRPWQRDRLIMPLFGSLEADGRRQYRTAFFFLPRKQGKTEVAAGIGLYCLCGEEEAGGEIYVVACNREQAGLLFNVAAQMVKNDRVLSRLCDIVESQKKITYRPTGSILKAIPAEAGSAHGYNASVVIADEVHAWPNRELWDVMRTSQGARSQPLCIAITTAGHDRNSLCYELYDYASKVRDGLVDDPSFLQVIYEAPKDADWTSEAVWHDANPALGDFRQIDEMRRACKEAQQIATQENAFRRLYLNQWTESVTRWISSETWNACAKPEFSPSDLDGQECFAGLDLSSTTDLTSFALVFPNVNGRRVVLSTCWIPEDSARERERRDRAPYVTWLRQGQIVGTPGNSIDYEQIFQHVIRCSERYNLRAVAIDRWNAVGIAQQLQQAGVEVMFFGQGFKDMSPAAKELERQVLSGELAHLDDAVLNWCLSNTMVEQDSAGNVKPSKAKSTEKIDAVVALVMATGVAMHAPESNEPQLIII